MLGLNVFVIALNSLKVRGGRDFTQEEMDSAMINQAPGTPRSLRSILSPH